MAARLTDRPGSSAYFAGGIVAYSNEAKAALVGVDPALIERVGAVSTEVAEALADGAVERFGADLGIGITGIAGPDGGTEEKPVGLVCFSVCSRVGGRSGVPRRARADHPQHAASRGPRRRPRPLDRGRDAPAAPPAERRGGRRAPARSGERPGAAVGSGVSDERGAAVRRARASGRGARRARATGARTRFAGRSGLRLVAPEALHVTLCFLGWQSVAEIEPIASSLRAGERARPPSSSVGEPVWLPPRRPRVLAVGLDDPAGALAEVQSALSMHCSSGGWYEPESRPFLAHVTVARVAKGARPSREPLRRRGRCSCAPRRSPCSARGWARRGTLRAAPAFELDRRSGERRLPTMSSTSARHEDHDAGAERRELHGHAARDARDAVQEQGRREDHLDQLVVVRLLLLELSPARSAARTSPCAATPGSAPGSRSSGRPRRTASAPAAAAPCWPGSATTRPRPAASRPSGGGG